MMAALKQAWQERAPRERAFLAVGAGILALVLCYVLVVDPMLALSKKAERVLPALQRQEAEMSALAKRAGELKAKPPAPAVMVDAPALTSRATKAGLSLQVSANDEGGFNVQLNKVEVAGLLGWLESLQSEAHLFVRDAQLDAAGSGQVSGRLVLAP